MASAAEALKRSIGGLSRRRRAVFTLQAFKFVELPAQFVLAIAAARALPPSDFGTTAILISIQSIYVALSTFGFDELLQRSFVRATDDHQRVVILATAFRARAISCGIGLVLGSVVAGILAMAGCDLAAPVLFLGLYGAATVVANGYESVGLAQYIIHATSFASLCGIVVPIALVATGTVDTTGGYMASLALGAFVRLLVSLYWHWRGTALVRGIRAQMSAAPVLLDSVQGHGALMAFGFTNLVLQRHGDVFVAGLVGISTVAIGGYALAYQITAACNQILLLGMGALGLTRLSEFNADRVALGHAWRRLSILAATLAVGPLCMIVLLAPQIVHITVGNRYPDLNWYLYALAATQWAARVGGGGTNMGTLIAANETGYVARSALGGAALNMCLDLILAPLLGVYGLAIGTGVAALVVGGLNIGRIVRLCTPISADPTRRSGALRLVPAKRLIALTAIFALAEGAAVAEVDVRIRVLFCGVVVIGWLVLCGREMFAK